jgi:hypothetical protein
MKKMLIALIVYFGSTASPQAQESQSLVCLHRYPMYSGIESLLASEVVATESALNEATQNIANHPNISFAKIKFWEDYSREFKIANNRLQSLVMYVDNPSRSSLEIREKFIEAEAEINLRAHLLKNTQKGNHAKWSIRKDFFEYKLSNLRGQLSTLRQICE